MTRGSVRDAARVGCLVALAIPSACSFQASLSASIECDGGGCSVSASARFFTGEEAAAVKLAPDELEMPARLAEAKKVEPGAILVAEDFVRRVTDVRVDGDTVHAATEQATLAEVVENGETAAVVDLASDPEVRASWSALSTKGEWAPDGRYSYTKRTEIVPIDGGKITLDYRFSLRPQLDVGLKFGWFSLKHAHAIARADLQTQLDVTGAFTAAKNKTYQVVLWRSPQFKASLPPIGPVPITIRSRLVLRAAITIDASGSVVVKTGFNLQAKGSYGFTYDGDDLESVREWNTDGSSITAPVMTAAYSVRVRGSVRAELDGGMFGGWSWASAGGGLRLYAEPYAEFSASSGTWRARAALNGGIDAYMAVLDRTVAEKSFALFKPEDEPVFGTWPAGGAPSPIVTPCSGAPAPGLTITCGKYSGCSRICAENEACLKDDDCSTGRCAGGLCRKTTPSAALGESCAADLDCIEGVCTAEPGPDAKVAHFCRPLHCSDERADDGESDFDCGGPSSGCRRCGAFARCKEDQDCAAGLRCRRGGFVSLCAKP